MDVSAMARQGEAEEPAAEAPDFSAAETLNWILGLAASGEKAIDALRNKGGKGGKGGKGKDGGKTG